MSTIRVGLIGCGKFATAQHLPNCAALPAIELFHCSSRSKTGQANAERFGAKKTTADYRDVLSDPAVDMVILSVPHEHHLFFVEETIKAGKNVLCEKPMTMTMDEAYRVVRAVREKGVKLCVDYNRRFSPAMVDMKRAFHAHRAGQRGQARVYTQEQDRRTWPEEETTNMLIRINDESATYGGVHIDWREGGGQIIGEGCHWLDLICWMLDERPVRVHGVGSTRLNYVITLEFANGALGCIFFSANGSFEYPKELVEIQDHGRLFRSECFVENQYFGRGERVLQTYPIQNDHFPDAGSEGGHAGYLAKIDAASRHFEQTGEYKYCFPDKGHRDLLQAFANSLMHDSPAPVDEMAGMRATYLSQRAMESIRVGHPLPLNVEDWDMYVHV